MPKKSSKEILIYECECCGGTFQKVKEGEFKCDHCGYVKHVETASSSEIVGLINEANRLRNRFDFDEAAEIFDQVVKKDPTNCEGYWGLFLCEYGIAHQEDPKTHKYLPTCNRASVVSVFDDENYKHAISFAGEFQKQDLEESGKQIDEILKKVVKLSQNEPPYDIFICYKKTSLVSNANGEESYTKDSIHAREIYEILTEQGYKVFFAEKTLQNIGGNEYEPIIFNALNTSHVMLVVSSKIEYINAPWVKNEWRRFVKQMEFDESKKLIPIMCGDMTPAKLPDLLKKYQALELDVNFQKNLLTSVKNCLGALRNNLKKVSIDGVKVAKKSNIVKSAVESRKISSSNQNVFKATEQIQLKNALRHFDNKTLNLSDAWTEFSDLKSIPKLTAISEYALELVKYKKKYINEKFNKKVLKEIQASPFNEEVFVEKFNTCVENVDKDTLDFVFKDITDEFKRDYASYNDKALLFEMIMSWDYEGKSALSQKAYEYILKYPTWRIKRLAEAFAKFYDQKDVDGYIEKLEKIADAFANNNDFELAQNFYDKVLEVDEGNTKIRWKKYYSGLKITDEGNIEYVIHRLTEKDTNDFKEFLSYVPAGQRNSYIHKMLKACTESLDVLGIRQKLENAQYLQYENNKHNWKLKVELIKKCVAGEAVSRKYLKKMIVAVNKEHGVNWDEKQVTKVFDSIVCLYSEKSTDSLTRDLYTFAEALKMNEYFEDAIKYFEMVVEEGKNEIKHKAYWGILQAKMKCITDEDMIYSKSSVKDYSEFQSALNCAGEVSDADAQRYLVIKNEQAKGYKRPKIKKQKAIKQKHSKVRTFDFWDFWDFIREHIVAILIWTAVIVGGGIWAGYTYSPKFMATAISTAEELQEIAQTKKKGKYYLKENIDLGKSEFYNLTFSEKFKGKFYGNGKTIYNYTITTDFCNVNGSSGDYSATSNIGLFRHTKGATIHNVTFENANIRINGWERVGIVVGLAEKGTKIKNVKIVNSSITTNGDNSSNICVGAIVGDFQGKYIKKCKVENTRVNGYSKVGGIAGSVSSEMFRNKKCRVKNVEFGGIVSGKSMVGGLVGEILSTNNHYKISGIYNSKTSKGTKVYGWSNTGGLVGHNQYSHLKESTNNADVICIADTHYDENTGKGFGGIMGKFTFKDNYGLWNKHNLSDLTNKGNVTVYDNNVINCEKFGGIIGDLYIEVDGNEKVTLTNCVNKGSIAVTTSDGSSVSYNKVSYVGGLVGWSYYSVLDSKCKIILKDCNQIGTVYGYNYVGTLVGYIYGMDYENENSKAECIAHSINGTVTSEYGYQSNSSSSSSYGY